MSFNWRRALAWPCLFALAAITIQSAVAQGPDDEEQRIDQYLDDFYGRQPAPSRHLNAAGQHVSCVPPQAQPAFRNPLLKDHVYAPEPSPELRALLGAPLNAAPPSAVCPAGMLEMVLPDRYAILAAGSLRNFLSKSPGGHGRLPPSAMEPPAVALSDGAYHAWSNGWWFGNAIGSQSTLNIWKPPLPTGASFSLSQLWVVGDAANIRQTQTVEAGWQVSPGKYGDSLPHLFVYWTADNYGKTGCYNLDCGAFVQVSRSLVAGQALPFSSAGSSQIEGTLAFYRDPTSHHWYLFQQNADGSYTTLGYYPVGIFGSGQLTVSANRLSFGGETAWPTAYGKAFAVPMGSGVSPAGSAIPEFGKVAYQRNLKYMGSNGVISELSIADRLWDCGYAFGFGRGADTSYGTGANWGNWLFFGGKGGC